MRFTILVLICFIYFGYSQDTCSFNRKLQISFLIGRVAHSSAISSQFNKTKAPFASSTFVEVNFCKPLTKRHQLFFGNIFTNYKFKYSAYYISRPDFESKTISRRTGSGSGYIKSSLMHGYSLIQTSNLQISSLLGPNINFLGRTGEWGESTFEIKDSTLNFNYKTIITDSIIKVRQFGLGFSIGANVIYKVEQKRNLFLNFKLLYNYGFNSLYETHTQTITNGILYDRSKIIGKGNGIFLSTGLTLVL
jgi:hypothetical protein